MLKSRKGTANFSPCGPDILDRAIKIARTGHFGRLKSPVPSIFRVFQQAQLKS